MIKQTLSLYIALFLAVGPVAAQVQEAAVSGKGGPTGVNATAAGPGPATVPGLPSADPGLTGTSPVIAAITAASVNPETLRTLAANPSPAAAYARALIAAPVAPAARAEAVKALGEAVVARLEAAVQTLQAQTSGSTKASTSLKTVAAEFAALGHRAPEALAVAGAAVSSARRLAPPKRSWSALKTAAIAATMLIAMTVTAPAIHAQNAVQGPAPVAAMGQMPAEAGPGQQQAEVVQASDINDAIAKWTPSTRLIIIGNPGLDQGSQQRLAAWLADKHWTVILMKNEGNSSYLDGEGRTHRGEDALNFAIGQGIPHKNGFSTSFIHEPSGLPDGSVLLMSMDEHFMTMHNSEAQRANGLDGETRFISPDADHPTGLDRWLINRMRHGHDIMGAVQETVTNIDALLDSAVAATAANAQSAVASAKSAVEDFARARTAFENAHPSAAAAIGAADVASLRTQVTAAENALASKKNSEATRIAGSVSATANAATSAIRGYESNFTAGQSAIAAARTDIDSLENASASFLKSHPKATGDLARPDVRAMREKLSSAESALSANPSGAKSAAEAAASEARRVQTALNEHAAGADQIAASEGILAQLESRERAGAAATDLVTAKQALREAREAHGLGASVWASQLQSAKSALANAERSISDADAAASRNALLAMLLWILLGLGTLGTGLFLNWRARLKAAEAQTLYDAWETGLHEKSNANIDRLLEKVSLYAAVSGSTKRSYTGQSAQIAAQVRSDSGQATLLLAKAREIHGRAQALLHPAIGTPGWLLNVFWTSRSVEAIRLLQDEPVTFKPAESEALFGARKNWRDDLFGDIKSYKPFQKSFNEVIAEFNKNAAAALASIERLEFAVTQSGKVIDGVAADLRRSAERGSAAAAADALFAVPSLLAKTIPAGETLVAKARSSVKTDPVSAIYGEAEQAKRVAADAKSLLDLIENARAHALAASTAAEEALRGRGIAAAWIGSAAQSLSEKAETAAAAAEQSPIAAQLQSLSAGLEDLGARAGRAADIARKVDEIVARLVGAAEAAIVAARTEVGRALGLNAERVLRENASDPSDYVAKARSLAVAAKTKLAAGELDAAEDAGAAAAKSADEAAAIAAASLQSLREQERTLAERRAETSRLDGLMPERRAILDGIERQFDGSVMALTSGDSSHPNANGTVADNIDEAEAAIAAAKAKADKSAQAYRAGGLLEAASLLSQALAHQQIADIRLSEIAEKRARLDAALAANAKTLGALEAKFSAWTAEIPNDPRSMNATLTAYDRAGKALQAARSSVEAAKGDPFKAAQELASVSAALDQVWVQVRNDRDAYAEVDRSLKAARTQLDSATRLASNAKGDNVTDSPAIASAYRDISALEKDYAAAAQSARIAHGDWPALDHEADRITNEAAHTAAALQGELAAAAKATEAISNASSKVREATNWTGSYGVSIPGSPGSGSVDSARGALNRGDYQGAIRHAEGAYSAAVAAIQIAAAEMARRRRAEEEERERQEAARRERQRQEDDRRRRSEEESRRSSSGSGGGHFGGSSSGSGGGHW